MSTAGLFLLLFVGNAIAVAVHEFGHFIGAVSVRIPVRKVLIGCGPLVGAIRWHGAEWEFRALPVMGLIQCGWAGVGRGRYAIMIASGVLGNLALVMVANLADSLGLLSPGTRDFLGPIIMPQLLLFLVNLVPFRIKSGNAVLRSDGLQLIQLYARSKAVRSATDVTFAEMMARHRSAPRSRIGADGDDRL